MNSARFVAQLSILTVLAGGCTTLHDAARTGDMAGVRRCIQGETDVDRRDDQGNTALMISVKRRHAEIARLLIDHGADINAADSHGTTPLMVAAGYGAQDIVATLEIGGATIDAHDNEGMTALMFAARCGRTEIVQELLSRQADPNARDKEGFTPLMRAAGEGHIDTVKALVAGGAVVTATNRYTCAFIAAVLWSPLGKMQTHGVGGVTFTMTPDDRGCLETIRFLVDHGADVNANYVYAGERCTALMHRVRRQYSVGDNMLSVVKVLIEKGAKVDAGYDDGVTPLMMAAHWGVSELDVVKFLVENGANVNARDSQGKTPLTWAGDDPHVTAFLRSQGAN